MVRPAKACWDPPPRPHVGSACDNPALTRATAARWHSGRTHCRRRPRTCPRLRDEPSLATSSSCSRASTSARVRGARAEISSASLYRVARANPGVLQRQHELSSSVPPGLGTLRWKERKLRLLFRSRARTSSASRPKRWTHGSASALCERKRAESSRDFGAPLRQLSERVRRDQLRT